MGVKKIYIIFDLMKYTKEIIKEDMMQEGFKHEFKFDPDVLETDDMILLIEQADEVWVFGDVSKYLSYQHAIDIGADIWEMGEK